MTGEYALTGGQKLVLVGLTALAVVAGLAVRIKGLGVWPLSVDEYYLTKSVLSILGNGLPGFECGGFYTRGILQQYLSAIAVTLMDNTELAMRIYPMIAALIVLWFTYLLARRAGGLPVACLALLLASLSLWEIEYSRFARMYMPFQALFMLQVYLFVRVIVDGCTDKFKWMLLVTLVGILSYEGAIFLAVLPLIAILRNNSLQALRYVLPTAVTVLLVVTYIKIPFQKLGVVRPPLPEELVTALASRGKGGLIDLPDLGHLSMLGDHHLWLVALLLLITGAGMYSLRWIRSLTAAGKLFWFATLAAFALSLIGLGIAIYLCMTLVLMDREQRLASRDFLKFALVPITVSFAVFWMAYLAVNTGLEPRAIASTLLKYPNISGPMLYTILKVVPVLMLVLLAPIAVYATVLFVRRNSHDDLFVLIGGLTLVFFISIALVAPEPFETRYSLFLYPLVLCLFAISMIRIPMIFTNSGRGILLSFLFAGSVFAATEDFSLHHYFHISTAEVNYRTNYPSGLREHYKSRNDGRTSSDFINARVKEGDTVIIAESAPDFYLHRVDYRYKEYWLKNFPNHITCGLEHDRWSNAPVLYTPEQIEAQVI